MNKKEIYIRRLWKYIELIWLVLVFSVLIIIGLNK